MSNMDDFDLDVRLTEGAADGAVAGTCNCGSRRCGSRRCGSYNCGSRRCGSRRCGGGCTHNCGRQTCRCC